MQLALRPLLLAALAPLSAVAQGTGQASEPFVSDGTMAGTLLAADVWPGQSGSLAGGYTRAGDKVYFIGS